eukprot:Amastigsp_a555_137.p2 type:complete len:224 gc:universal Amastigsp_a555_137:427-1098(+)
MDPGHAAGCRGASSGAPQRAIENSSRHEPHRYRASLRRHGAAAHRRERAQRGTCVPVRSLDQPLCCALHTKRRRHDGAQLWRRHESRLWRPHQRARHRLGVDMVRRSRKTASARRRPGCNKRRHSRRWRRRTAPRDRRLYSGSDGVVRGRDQRQNASRALREEPLRTLNRAVPHPRGQICAAVGPWSAGQNGRGRGLRHRDLWLDGPRKSRRRHGVLALHARL